MLPNVQKHFHSNFNAHLLNVEKVIKLANDVLKIFIAKIFIDAVRSYYK